MASKDPTIRAIELEAARLAALDGNTSLKERFEIRNRLRSEAGLTAEKRKLGGVAGVVDRNRNFVGNLAKNVAPALSFLPGVGPVVSGLVSAGGRAMQKGANLGSIVKSGLSGAAMGGAAQGAQGALAASKGAGLGARALAVGKGAVAGAADPFRPTPSALPEAAPNTGSDGNILSRLAVPGALPGSAPAAGGGTLDRILGAAGGVARTLTGGGNLLDAGMLGLAGQQMLASGAASKRSQGFADKAIGLSEKRWNDAEGLRTAGNASLLNPRRTSLSAVYADPTNPFASASPVPAPVALPTSPATPLPTSPVPPAPMDPQRRPLSPPALPSRGGVPLPRRVR